MFVGHIGKSMRLEFEETDRFHNGEKLNCGNATNYILDYSEQLLDNA